MYIIVEHELVRAGYPELEVVSQPSLTGSSGEDQTT